jgi:hypothetical protein
VGHGSLDNQVFFGLLDSICWPPSTYSVAAELIETTLGWIVERKLQRFRPEAVLAENRSGILLAEGRELSLPHDSSCKCYPQAIAAIYAG